MVSVDTKVERVLDLDAHNESALAKSLGEISMLTRRSRRYLRENRSRARDATDFTLFPANLNSKGTNSFMRERIRGEALTLRSLDPLRRNNS
jgi:hypothetical protein